MSCEALVSTLLHKHGICMCTASECDTDTYDRHSDGTFSGAHFRIERLGEGMDKDTQQTRHY
jgi:hypothetical protein